MPIAEAEIDRQAERLGRGLAAERLSRNLTQAQLATEAGLSLSTLRRLEDGKNISLDNLIRVMDALQIAGRLDALTPALDIRPVERVRRAGRERKRAAPAASPSPASRWAWGDQS
nr:helix-turn-helix transcriptional regulator [Brevundimonas naejangsanensis]